jgi:hypothetical protein
MAQPDNLALRLLEADAIPVIADAFDVLGWPQAAAEYAAYLADQERGLTSYHQYAVPRHHRRRG